MIEKGIPLPSSHIEQCDGADTGKGKRNKYPWRDCLEIGDSFIAPESDLNKVYESARKFCQRNKGVKFEVHKLDSGEIRVWRVAN